MSGDAPLAIHLPPKAEGLVVILMGVTGAGKTTVGVLLAKTLGWTFYDADDFHSAENKARMHAGEALTDEEREPWLVALETMIRGVLAEGKRAVLACSALRAGYRDRLRRPGQEGLGEVRIVFLRISPEEAKRRVEARKGHYMPASLVGSQFSTLEEPDDVLALDASRTPAELVREIETAWQL